tara:strand:- start:14 stop:286 length:273 start_codon:yes stop_codon:yes gene_type:complete
MSHKRKKISRGVYSYRGYVIEKQERESGYYGGTAFKPDRWNIKGTKLERSTLKDLCEDMDEFLDDDFWRDANGNNVSILKTAIKKGETAQ